MNLLGDQLGNKEKHEIAIESNTEPDIFVVCAGCIATFILGSISAWFLWNFIYSIGSRVISDENYTNLELKVVLLGGCGSSLLGLSCSLFPPQIAFKWFAAGQLGALLLGCAGGNLSWIKGVSAYLAS